MPEQQQHHISQEVVQYSSSLSSHSGGSSIATSLDELAKGLANGTLSRGKAIRLVGGALLGAALASVPGVAWADDDRCSEGQTRCGDRCVNLQRNERHCGSCFHRCAEGEECVSGVCQGGGCPRGTTPCGTQCCQTGTTCVEGTCCPDAQVCGAGTSLTCCAEGQECVDGVCSQACLSNGGTCTSGAQCCSGNCKGGTCVASCIPPSAIACTGAPDSCPGGVLGGCGCTKEASGAFYCATGGTGIPCSTSCDCPSGQLCQAFGGGNLCATAAEVCPISL